jgi:hypothetical protein
VREVIERELGHPAEEVFEWIGERPMAAASIGQVHAAHLRDGREVVVKVQYPGVADAIRADLANTELICSFARLAMKLSPIRMTADPSALAEEVTERITEELDYRIEAANQTEFATYYRGHPFIRIPEVVRELSTERILVMDEHDGLRWSAALDQPQELKDAWGEVIDRFVFGSLYELSAFNADPHPGNYLFHDDGSVSFLDFGCVKRFPDDHIAAIRRMAASIVVGEGDPDALHQVYADLHFIKPGTKIDTQRLFDWWAPIWDPGRGAQPFTFTPEVAAEIITRNFDPLGVWGDVVRRTGIGQESKEWTFLTRIQLGLYSVLGALRATRDWRAIHDEITFGDPPETDLGHRHQVWRDRAAPRSS